MVLTELQLAQVLEFSPVLIALRLAMVIFLELHEFIQANFLFEVQEFSLVLHVQQLVLAK